MREENRCEHCGEPMTEGVALGGACPRCMLALGIDSPADGYGSRSEAFAHTVAGADGVAPPAAIARYRILRLIGEGGMGAVYEAEQDHPRRTVALKIIKPGISHPGLLRRFEQESHALGRLQHPGIAQIYEAGTADTGFGPQPYFAMELIRGTALTEYAEAFHLTTRDRLAIVSRVADAVHHAHQRGLIHRDLKPANILVDETGQPKILDFGVARATDSDTQATSQTDIGQLLGTLAYMSPEQTLGDPLEIDTRSDVYALGVILYELLAGRLPSATAKTLPDTIRAIREEEPVRLGAMNRSYRGDIETIVATALEKDKARRYGSAGELAADIRRSLQDEPIVARPPSVSYQLQKFARRNRSVLTGMAAGLILLVAGIVAISPLVRKLIDERDRTHGDLQAAIVAREQASIDLQRAVEAEREARQRATAAEAQSLAADQASQPEQPAIMRSEGQAQVRGGNILIDASQDGGAWWSPQFTEFDAGLDHQGRGLAEYFRLKGADVEELPRITPFPGPARQNLETTASHLAGRDLVIRVGSSASDKDIAVYHEYVVGGGKLLLLADAVKPNQIHRLAESFGIRLAGVSRGENVIDRFAPHAITRNVGPVSVGGVPPYDPGRGGGSGVVGVTSDKVTVLGFMSKDTYLDLNFNEQKDSEEPVGAGVLGVVRHGEGVVVFLSDIGTLELLPQPLTANIYNYLMALR